MKNKSILLTGGHAGTTALATIEELQSRKLYKKISWIGNKRAIEKADIKTIEAKLFPDMNVDYYEVDSGRLQKKFSNETISSLLKLPNSFLKTYKLVAKIKPEVVLSFGGAVSVPVVFAAWIMGIPIVIHEQTIEVGLANKITSLFAEKIALARVESKKHFNTSKCVHVGNPINSFVRSVNRNNKKLNDKNIHIYITGGSRGSQIINKAVFDSLDALCNNKSNKNKYNFIITHQTGDLDIQKAIDLKNKHKLKHYLPQAFTHPKDLKKILEQADIVIARSGANTVAELIAFSIPSILIPIPWTRYDEQTKNAHLTQKAGVSIILKEDRLSEKSLIKAIYKLIKDYDNFTETNNLKTTSKDLDAHLNLVNLLEDLVS